MNPEIKAQWVAALRSGKYTQGKGVLKRADGAMCCLGVLCDVIDPSGWEKERHGELVLLAKKTQEIDCFAFTREYEGETVQDSAQFSGRLLREVGLQDSTVADLIGMNDTEDRDFAFIANYVESLT